MAAEAIDYSTSALGSTQEDFVAACPFPFLISTGRIIDGEDAGRAGSFDTVEDQEPTALDHRVGLSLRSRTLILAVRKKQSVFANMITVGRTSNNDVVVRATQVSKFHAFFRIAEGVSELADAGSLNGTWIGADRLPPKGVPRVVQRGDLVRFGPFEFRFLDAAALWTHVHGGT